MESGYLAPTSAYLHVPEGYTHVAKAFQIWAVRTGRAGARMSPGLTRASSVCLTNESIPSVRMTVSFLPLPSLYSSPLSRARAHAQRHG